jgi:hypothetical protein
LYTNQLTNNVIIIDGIFSYLYRGVNLGEANVIGNQVHTVKVTNSKFEHISTYGIYADFRGNQSNGATGVTHIVSAFNSFTDVGYGQIGGATPAYNVIFFGGKNCYSIADTFDRDYSGAFPPINLNNKSSFATLPDGKLLLGSQLSVGGLSTNLTDATLTAATAGVIGSGLVPTILEYTVLRGTDQRTGTMKITSLGANVIYDDEYVETADLYVDLVPVVSSGTIVLQYTTAATGTDATLKTATRTLL